MMIGNFVTQMARVYIARAGLFVVALFALASPVHAAPFVLKSPDVREGAMLTLKQVYKGFGCTGGDVSPALSWDGAPKGTKSFALTLYDPDAPTGSGWWHWLVVDIPATVTSLPEGAGSGAGLPGQTWQGRNDFGQARFGGACPPPGPQHRYEFRIYALDVAKLPVPHDASAAMIGFMISAHKLGEAKLTAVYKR